MTGAVIGAVTGATVTRLYRRRRFGPGAQRVAESVALAHAYLVHLAHGHCRGIGVGLWF